MKATTKKSSDKIQVFYDGSCPLCAAEIAHYRRADTEQALELVDVSSDTFTGDDKIDRATAMARFHVKLADGRLMSGAQGFVEVWRVIPSWTWLAKLAALPGIAPAMEPSYRVFLKLRPLFVSAFAQFHRITGKA